MKYSSLLFMFLIGCSSVQQKPASNWEALSHRRRSIELSHAIYRCKSIIYTRISDTRPPSDLLELCLAGPPDDFAYRLEQRKTFLKKPKSGIISTLYVPEKTKINKIIDSYLDSMDEEELEDFMNYLGIPSIKKPGKLEPIE